MSVYTLIDTRNEIEVLNAREVDRIEFTSFFQEGYGPAYHGDARLHNKLDRSTHAVTLRESERTRRLEAVALVAGRRVLSIATTPSRDRLRTRQENFTLLLKSCFDRLGSQWLTVGQDYHRVQATVAEAGMARVNNEDLASSLLSAGGELDNYEIRRDESEQLIVARVASEHRPDYAQQLWVYPPNIEN